ncbi:hypothetical protein FGO68_gene8947 [Halteria grandinella]|uniref:Uncharacterized protein n=1 Tax=Halteria grandinella TaxID=5974 RepID=A0A8J8NSA2_HALGN|nr:hypothetical protein FGO68_gene8947 [Halteria grandinella]
MSQSMLLNSRAFIIRVSSRRLWFFRNKLCTTLLSLSRPLFALSLFQVFHPIFPHRSNEIDHHCLFKARWLMLPLQLESMVSTLILEKLPISALSVLFNLVLSALCIEYVSAKLAFNIIELMLIKVYCTLQTLIVVLLPIYYVDVTLGCSPVGHYFPIEVIKLMQPHPSLEVVQLFLDLISFGADIRNLNTKGSFDHSPDPREACTILPPVLHISRLPSNNWIYVHLVILRLKLLIFIRHLFSHHLRPICLGEAPPVEPVANWGVSVDGEYGRGDVYLVGTQCEYTVRSRSQLQ